MDISYENIFSILNQRRPRATQKCMSIPLARCPQMQQSVFELSSEIKPLFYAIFTKEEHKELILKNILPFKQYKTPMPVCNKLLTLQQIVFRCYQCTTHEAAVLCLSCFEKGNHKGHRFSKIQSGGGNCDCGNPDAIAPQGFCVDHKGTAEEMIISQQEDNKFNLYIRQIFVWILKVYKLGLTKQADDLLVQLIRYLDWLNNESLFYNTLTNKLLFSGQNQMIDHIMILGAEKNFLATKATQLFLKMFSLEVFKENIATAYLRAYNRINNFQSTKFEQLFIQLFANNDLVQKIITKSGLYLDPRQRKYDAIKYYNSLHFMSTIKQRAAKIFFTPIIEKGGVDCQFMDQIQKECQVGKGSLSQLYSAKLNTQNYYYSVNKVLIKLMKNSPQFIEKEIENQYSMIMKYSYNKNKIVLANPRIFVILMFIICQGDLQKLDIEKVREILKVSKEKMRELLVKLTRCFFFCLKQYGRCIANSGFGKYSFDSYVDLYARGGNIVINLDMLGIKFCAVALQKINQKQCFSQTILSMFNEDRQAVSKPKQIWQNSEQQQEQQQSSRQPNQKQKQANILFYLSWLNTISFFTQVILFQKAQVNIGTELEIINSLMNQMSQNQFKKLMLNARQLTIQQMQAIGIYWFSQKDISKELVSKYVTFDKAKKKFVIKEDVKGIPVKRQLLKSLAKSPDYYLKNSDHMEMEITNKTRRFRQSILPSSLLRNIYKGLINHFNLHLKQDHKYLKELANQLKIINMLFQYDNEVIEDIIADVIILAECNQKLKTQVSAIFHQQKKGNMQEDLDKEKNQKRKELLKKKKEQKLKQFKNKGNVQKFLQQNQKEENQSQHQLCIICHSSDSQNPLYYMASTFYSNIVYSVLGVDGINPFFLSCFHQVHHQCYISMAKEHQRVNCPLCKAFTNILVPTQDYVNNAKVVQTAFERMGVIFALQSKKKEQNIYIQIMKSFIQLFFSQTIQEGIINTKQIKLFKILFQLVKAYFNMLPSQQKDVFCENLTKFSQKYDKESKNSYNLGLLIDFIFQLSIRIFKGETINQQYMGQLVQNCKYIPKNDIKQSFSLACKLFDLHCSIDTANQSEMEEQGKQLKSYIKIFDPPKTIRSLLQQRKNVDSQNICKQGHNICICLICAWKGCFDCGACNLHTRDTHNKDTIYFNFMTGGFYHQYNSLTIHIRSLYVNELGMPWKPQYKDENYYFDIDIFKKMVQALKSGNLIQMIRNNYEELAIQNNQNIWRF